MTNDFEQIAGLRVAAGQHAHEALRRTLRATTQVLEPNRRVDVVAQQRFPLVQISREQALDTFAQKRCDTSDLWACAPASCE
jgi:hypothetical protein